MKKVEYLAPTKLDEMIHLLGLYGDKTTVVLAGGTDIVPKINCYEIRPEVIIHIGNLGLDYIRQENGKVLIGSMTTTANLALHSLIVKWATALSEAAALSACQAVRNSATIGGNLANASPAADLVPPLLVMSAEVLLLSPSGTRIVPLDRFFLGPGKTILKRDELIVEVQVPVFRGKTIFLKLGRRRAMTLSVVNTSVRLDIEDGTFKDAAIAVGAVAPTPLRCSQAEVFIQGKVVDSAIIEKCATIASKETKPIDDQRATGWYRRKACSALVRRAIHQIAHTPIS